MAAPQSGGMKSPQSCMLAWIMPIVDREEISFERMIFRRRVRGRRTGCETANMKFICVSSVGDFQAIRQGELDWLAIMRASTASAGSSSLVATTSISGREPGG